VLEPKPNFDQSLVSDAARVSSSPCCDFIRVGGYHIANIYKPPTEHRTTQICHQSFLILQSWLETLTANIRTGDIRRLIKSGYLNNDYLLLHDAKQCGTFHSARWQRDYLPDLCWISMIVGCSQPASSMVLGDFPHSQHRPSVTHIGLQHSIIIGIQRRR